MSHLSSLLPLANDADDAAESSGQTNDTIIEGDQSKGGTGDGEVEEVGEELLSGSGALTKKSMSVSFHTGARVWRRKRDLHGDALALDDALAILLINLGLPLSQSVLCVELSDDTANDAHGPESVRLLLKPRSLGPLPNAGSIQHGGGIAGQITSVTQLATDGSELEEGIGSLGVGSGGRGLEVLNVLAEAQDLAGEAELLLDGGPGGDLRWRAVGAQQIPRVEARKVLKYAQQLIATDGGGDEAEIVGD